QLVPTKAEPVKRAGTEILQQHIGLFEKAAEQLLAARRFEVERQALLVGVEEEEEEAVRIRLVAHVAARHLADFRRFELDHLGAEKRQDLRTSRPRLVVRHVDDADAVERLGHGNSPDQASVSAVTRICPWVRPRGVALTRIST